MHPANARHLASDVAPIRASCLAVHMSPPEPKPIPEPSEPEVPLEPDVPLEPELELEPGDPEEPEM